MTRRERRSRFLAAARARAVPARNGARRAVRVHIDDLVLHGFPAHSARGIGDGVVAELTQLFASRGVPRPMLAMHGTELANAVWIEAPAAGFRSSVGERIARALYGVRP